jgi:addiction module HigA family antidote
MKKHTMHPGHILKSNYLDLQQKKTEELAEELDISNHKLTKIIKGQASITYDLAKKLAKIFDTTTDFWMMLQSQYDQAEKERGTDSPFYQLMTIMGDAVLKLVGVKSENDYTAHAIVLKDKRLYPDIVAMPKDKNKEIVMLEFQGYKEPMIKYILTSKITMLCTQEEYTGQVLGAIVYTDQKFMDASLPCRIDSQSGTSQIRGEFVEIKLSSFTEKQLIAIDPKLIVLAPFTISEKISDTDYVKKCRKWKKKIDRIFTEETVHQVTDLLSFFILNRRRNLTAKEVQSMFNFDISQTRVGKDLLQEGEKRGEKKGEKKLAKKLIAEQLSTKFNIEKRRIMPRLEPLRTIDMLELAKLLLNMNQYEEAYQWIDNRKKMNKMTAIR